MFDCSNGLRSNTHFVVIMAEIEHVNVSNEAFMEEVPRYECVYHRNSKDFKDKHKKANCWDKIGQKFDLSAGEAEAKFRNIRTAYGQPTRACIFDTSADQNVWLGRLCDRCDYMETAFFAIVWDCLRSAICDLRSSAIVCDHMETSL